MSKVIVSGADLVKYFPVRGGLLGKTVGYVHAVDQVGIDIFEGEVLALVGESGSGKSTLGRLLVGSVPPDSGRILFDGVDVVQVDGDARRELRRSRQMIFQDPYASLNPRKTVRNILSQALILNQITHSRKETEERMLSLLASVGLTPPETFIDRFPHELSGGQKQRLSIARALSVNPRFIVADEPVSSLDISIRSQILKLMLELQRSLKLTYLFITHDLGTVWSIADRIAVMYLGKIVELASSDELQRNQQHPYTQALLASTPLPDPEASKAKIKVRLTGEPPSPLSPPSGCRFRTRCRYAYERCKIEEPRFYPVGDSHWASCHLILEPEMKISSAGKR